MTVAAGPVFRAAASPLGRLDGTNGAADPYALAGRFWQLAVAALTAVTIRELGAATATAMWTGALAGQQREAFLGGLAKLGIDRHGPPAVVAGQYHYLTNVIGGLHMQYVEESPQKVWNRNMAPLWSYPGLLLLSIPVAMRHAVMASWHPNDGRMLGTRRLGWVITRTVVEGEPYDEGYFQEYPYDLRDDQLVRHEKPAATPPCRPEAQPRLDPALWPAERVFRARRSYARGYLQAAIGRLQELHGDGTAGLLRLALRGVAAQCAPELFEMSGADPSSPTRCADFAAAWLASCGQAHARRDAGPVSRITVETPIGGLPEAQSPALRAAYLDVVAGMARMLDGGTAVRVAQGATPEAPCTLEIENTGRWLW